MSDLTCMGGYNCHKIKFALFLFLNTAIEEKEMKGASLSLSLSLYIYIFFFFEGYLFIVLLYEWSKKLLVFNTI
jgi:hypothetical protein